MSLKLAIKYFSTWGTVHQESGSVCQRKRWQNHRLSIDRTFFPLSLPTSHPPKKVSHSSQFLSIKLLGWQSLAQQLPGAGNGKQRGKSSWNKWGRWVFSASHGKQIIFTFYYLSIISCKYKTYLNHPKFLKESFKRVLPLLPLVFFAQ